jgi:hypothetical protein
MQRRNLSDRIIKLDRNIRFVGVVNSRGEVIEGGFQHGVQPLLEGTDEQQMYIQSLSNMTMFQNYSNRLGKVRYSITEHEKVTLMTFPLDDGILCVSASPKADINKIRNKVSKVIKERPAAKKKNKKPTK